MTRIWALAGPTNVVTTTVTTGSRMYLASACLDVLRELRSESCPSAGTSSTSGVVTLPSGRTGTIIDSSGLRQTMMFTVSSGPIMYWKSDVAASRGAGG